MAGGAGTTGVVAVLFVVASGSAAAGAWVETEAAVAEACDFGAEAGAFVAGAIGG